jgi:trypsin
MWMRVLFLVLAAGLGHARAAEWQWLGDATERAAPAPRPVPDALAATRIINGVPTGEYPAVAGLEIVDATTMALCTGTLVSPSVVLTAAHCVGGSPVAIRVTFFPDGTTAAHYWALAYAIHPEYSFPDADLALVLLEAPVAGVASVPLTARKPRSGKSGTIVGYGRDEAGIVGLKQKGTVRLRRCPRRVPQLGLLPGSLGRALCWRSRPGEQDTCHGDSGGPLLVGGYLAGVTSGGDEHCTGSISWDTNVVPFLPWIQSLLR